MISDALSRIFTQAYADAPAVLGSLEYHNLHYSEDVVEAMDDLTLFHPKSHYPSLCAAITDTNNSGYPSIFNRPWNDQQHLVNLEELFAFLSAYYLDNNASPAAKEEGRVVSQVHLAPAADAADTAVTETNEVEQREVEPEVAEGKYGPPLSDTEIDTFFSRFHNVATGHLGLSATIAEIEKLVDNKPLGLRQAIIRKMSSCAPCAKNRHERKGARYERHNLSGRRPFHTVQIDVLTGFPTASSGNCKILVVVDTFTRYAVLVPIANETAETACFAFLQIYGTFGTISRIVSDGGPAFISEGWSQLVQTLGIFHEVTQPHLPQSHGIVERQHSMLLNVARKVFLDLSELSEDNWDRYIPLVQRIMNSHETVATGFAPSTLLFGHTLVTDQQLLLTDLPARSAEETPLDYVRVLDDLLGVMRREGLIVAEDRAIQGYEQEPTTDFHKQFNSGDHVLFKNFLSVTGRLGKLSPRFVGPALVLERLSDDFYKLKDIVQDVEIYAHARHLMKFNTESYTEEELLDMACTDYMEHTINFIVDHTWADPEGPRRPGNLRFTVAFKTDLVGHKGHTGLLWRDLKHVPAFKDYVRKHLKKLQGFLPREDTGPQGRPHARAKASARLRGFV